MWLYPTQGGGGSQAAKEMGLNFEFAAFKAKLLADGHLVPAKLTAQFDAQATGPSNVNADQFVEFVYRSLVAH